MDKLDRKILAELQRDGRQSLTDLAKAVQTSLTSCHRRVKALEDAGTISGYHAQVDPKAVGLEFDALVFITMESTASSTVEAFEELIPSVPNVLLTRRLFGDPDYLLHVATADLAAFQVLYDERLSTLPGVKRLTSTLVMKTIAPPQPLPL